MREEEEEGAEEEGEGSRGGGRGGRKTKTKGAMVTAFRLPKRPLYVALSQEGRRVA